MTTGQITSQYGISFERAKSRAGSIGGGPKTGWAVYHIATGQEVGGGHHRHDTQDAAIRAAHEMQMSADRRTVDEQAVQTAEAIVAAVAGPTLTQAPAVELATGRQVDFIMTLLARRARDGEGGGFFSGPTDRAGVASLTKSQASQYIWSLKGEY